MKRLTLIFLAILMVALPVVTSARDVTIQRCFDNLDFEGAQANYFPPAFAFGWDNQLDQHIDNLRALDVPDVYQRPMTLRDVRIPYVIGGLEASNGDPAAVYIYDAAEWPGMEAYPGAWLIVPLGPIKEDGHRHPPSGCSIFAVDPGAFVDAVTE